jgi:biopolymer transport protein ExbD
MAIRPRRQVNKMPEVNLVPMLDVLMTILTFFIIVSMTLTGIKVLDIEVPNQVSGADEKKEGESVQPMIIGLREGGELVYDNKTTDVSQLAGEIQTYFAENPEGVIVLKADRKLPYSEVSKLLVDLRDIGGRKVSLSVE